MLVRPADEEDETTLVTTEDAGRSESEKHVLSPLLVDAISRTAQVVWAHTKKQEGLIGRSDIRLQTAVGMPVAVDGSGNMCVVVMFSPNNIQSTDDAMEYLQSISKSATSTSIPSLLPAFDPKQGLVSLPHHHAANGVIPLLSSPAMSDGVTTRFVSLEETPSEVSQVLSVPEVQSEHDLSSAPKDCFGIPMLPSAAEISSTKKEMSGNSMSDAFDEASYGVWSTIMDNIDSPTLSGRSEYDGPLNMKRETANADPIYTLNKPEMAHERIERLEEFASAFLEVSVFDFAEIWIPIGDQTDHLGQVTSIISTDSNPIVKEFIQSTEKILIKSWSGAIGRAYASGNPVWSSNRNVFIDAGRSKFFERMKMETALAVPVFSGKSATPSFIFSCYSFVRSGTVPFVLKFVQQALRLLWKGLDQVQPHSSLGDRIWNELEPADLGEMAADVEMQQHFMRKKRPRESISEVQVSEPNTEDDDLDINFEALEGPSGVPSVRSIYTGSRSSPFEPIEYQYNKTSSENHSLPYSSFENIHGQMQDALKSIGRMKPVHQSVTTNEQGSKRAHILLPSTANQELHFNSPFNQTQADTRSAAPLSAPRPLAAPGRVLVNPQSPGRIRQEFPFQYHDQSVDTTMQQDQNQQPLAATIPPSSQQPQTFAFQQRQPHRSSPVVASEARTMPSIPKDQISATGISFSIPTKAAAMNSLQGPQHSQTPASVNSSQFCMPVSQPMSPAKLNGNGKPCRIKGCNEPSVARRPYCVRHSGNRMCEHEGCSKCAQGATRFCIAHGGGRRCTYPGCDKGARDKFFCAAHGGGKRCRFDGCNKSAVGGSKLCTAHGGGRRCSVEGCDKSAQSSTKFCVKHGGGKKCSHEGCEKVARGRTQYCAAHGGGVRCKLAGCSRVAIGKYQLCRAHGGGVRSSKDKNESEDISPPPQHFMSAHMAGA
eukprot:scaffold6331_cov195-Cylindrotheca_fusiformis.AAC.12